MNSNKGFTLVEILVVILLLTVVAVISSDMIVNLTSTSAKVQNKITVEEEYSFLNAKLSKLIQDADNVIATSDNKLVIYYPDNKIYTLEYFPNEYKLNLEGTQLSATEIGKSTDFFLEVRGDNPKVVHLNFGISKDFGNQRLEAATKFERRITVNKTY